MQILISAFSSLLHKNFSLHNQVTDLKVSSSLFSNKTSGKKLKFI